MAGVENPSNFSDNQIKYARFLGRGKKDRNGNKQSKAMFAKYIGVNPDTLYEWQRLPGFKELVFEYAVSDHVDRLPDLIIAQIAKATGQELTDARGRKIKPGDTGAFMALMRQFELLKADRIETKQEVTNIDAALSE